MATSVHVRPLTVEDSEDFRALRLEGLLNRPSAFGSSYEEEAKWTIHEVRQRMAAVWTKAPAALWGAFSGNRLIGTIGIFSGHHLKNRHKLTIWGMYVTPSYRNSGAGRALVTAALAHARLQDGVTRVELAVESTNSEAKRLYQSMGFERWGTEPSALIYKGQSFDEDYMSLSLTR